MAAYFRAASAIASLLFLAACAARVVGDAKPDPTCLTQTGSRMAVNGSSCSAVGRSYTSEDINRTGATTAAGALRLMDPSITVHQ
jgi:hypothetical protein